MTISNRERPELDFANLPLMLTDVEAAQLLRLSVSFLRKSRCEGQIGNRTPAPPFIYVGGRVRYITSDLKQWVEQHERRAAI